MPDDDNPDDDLLFPLPERQPEEPVPIEIRRPLWTENKSKLIERYLYYFVLITHHGTYLDGFAGPQEPNQPDMWSAKLVLENQPKRLRHFHLFETDPDSYKLLEQLQTEHPDRDIQLYPGDCNVNIPLMLEQNPIREKEATFCLLDQRTFECHWSTVKALAEHKKERKIELFYFFANAWHRRAITQIKEHQKIANWWGRDDWPGLIAVSAQRCKEKMVERFRTELGYWSAKAYPIFRDRQGRSVMYWMIHATDHPDAPRQMARAYNSVGLPKETAEQLLLELNVDAPSDES